MREIARAAYSNTPNGMLGNEDCGQMSAWYMFAALGFYPLNPASAEYLIGSPLFSRVTLTLPGGRHFVVAAPQNSATNLYIQAARLNGKPLTAPLITWRDIQGGGLLEFDMAGAVAMGRRLARHPARRRKGDVRVDCRLAFELQGNSG